MRKNNNGIETLPILHMYTHLTSIGSISTVYLEVGIRIAEGMALLVEENVQPETVLPDPVDPAVDILVSVDLYMVHHL
jgi:hypothetical protein